MLLKSFFRRVWPKYSLADKIAFSFTHFGLIGIFLFELLIVLPIYHKPWTLWYCLHLLFALWFEFSVFANMYQMILTDSTVKSEALRLPSVLRQGWYYCPNCQINAPPRAHHCPICDICIIKRDHHCIFTGNCVGFYNHRYFFCMAFYLWIGCTYTVLFNLEFYGSVIGELQLATVVKMVFPMLAWTLGYVTLYELGITLVAGVTFMAMFLFSCLLGFQIFFISRGQTQFECKKKIRDFHRNLYENIVVVFGKRWYLTAFLPYCESELPGDGTEFFKTSPPPDTKRL